MVARVFVLGAARSGTKIFRDCLGAADEVAAVPYDVGYVWRYGNEALAHDELLPSHANETIGAFVARTLASMGRRAHGSDGYEVLVEKSVPNVLRPAFVATLFPDARFVNIVRDGRAVIESSMRNWRSPSDRGYLLDKLRYFPPANYRYALWYAANKLRPAHRSGASRLWGPRYAGMERDAATMPLIDVCSLQWRHCVERCADQLAALDPVRVATLRYEDLVAGPEALERVCAFAGIRDTGSVLRFHARRFDPSRGAADRSRLSEAEQSRVEALAGPTLERLGYA